MVISAYSGIKSVYTTLLYYYGKGSDSEDDNGWSHNAIEIDIYDPNNSVIAFVRYLTYVKISKSHRIIVNVFSVTVKWVELFDGLTNWL